MNDSSSNIPDENSQNSHDDSQNIPEDAFHEITSDGIFTIKISEDMKLRNTLRSGLVEAQGKDTDKIPMYVSWPHWLEDGIVCLFARDFQQVLHKAVQDTAITLGKTFEVESMDIEPDSLIEEEDSGVETLSDIENEEEKEKSETDNGQETATKEQQKR